MMKKILIIDDDRSMTKLLNFMLKDQYEVIISNNAKNALQILEKIPVDGVITDISMQDMDGYDLIHHIRKDEDHSELPVLVLSARTLSEDRIKGLELGADDYLTKPFHPDELKLRLKKILNRSDLNSVS